jgi:hypothetical protein
MFGEEFSTEGEVPLKHFIENLDRWQLRPGQEIFQRRS